MFETIRLIAVKEDKACHGVWASFGKPYVCLGEPTEVGELLGPMVCMDQCHCCSEIPQVEL